MDPTIYFTSDQHFYHRNVIKLCNRPFASLDEMHNVLISNHNKVVKPNDLVIHCGDFCFGSAKPRKEILARLNGRHILVLGNHDKGGAISALKAGFSFVCTEFKFTYLGETFRVKHYPYAPPWWKVLLLKLRGINLRYLDRRPKNDGTILIHGHTHSKTKMYKNSVNVCVDAWNFRPVSISQIQSLLRPEKS